MLTKDEIYMIANALPWDKQKYFMDLLLGHMVRNQPEIVVQALRMAQNKDE